MNINRTETDTEIPMNMTPMIDVVFLLIVFFMIITDLTQQELEELKLPVAMEAVPDEPDPKVVRPVINILHTGEMIVKKRKLFDPENEDLTTLENFLSDQASLMPKKPNDPTRPPSEANKLLPDNPVLLRPDQWTEFKHLQRIMQICSKPDIAIWKLEMAASEDPEKVAARKAAEGN